MSNKVKLTVDECGCNPDCGCKDGQETKSENLNTLEDLIKEYDTDNARLGTWVDGAPKEALEPYVIPGYPVCSTPSSITRDGSRYFGNDNISKYIVEGEHNLLIQELSEKMEAVLDCLIIDREHDHNTNETARRVAKMMINEIYSGRYYPAPKITDFPNVSSYDQLYITGPISVRSMCSHHQMPIVGSAYIGVYPGSNVIGLSKFNRIVDWVVSRPQIQEEMTQQIADEIEKDTQAEGVAVIVKAEHFCMSHRGVKENSPEMLTSVMRGKFLTNFKLKSEFLNLISLK